MSKSKVSPLKRSGLSQQAAHLPTEPNNNYMTIISKNNPILQALDAIDESAKKATERSRVLTEIEWKVCHELCDGCPDEVGLYLCGRDPDSLDGHEEIRVASRCPEWIEKYEQMREGLLCPCGCGEMGYSNYQGCASIDCAERAFMGAV